MLSVNQCCIRTCGSQIVPVENTDTVKALIGKKLYDAAIEI